MLHGKELILATKPFAKEVRSKSWLYTLSTLFFLIAALSGTVLLPHWSLQLLSSILSGFLIVRMFVIYHDHQHHTILTKSRTADIIMTIFGIYILAPTSIWSRSHNHHHAHNSKLFSASIGSYPVATIDKYNRMTRSEKFGYLAIRHPLNIAMGYFTIFIGGMCCAAFISSPKRHFDALLALVIHIALAVTIVLLWGWQTWIFLFLIPFGLACAIGSYLFYAQHNFPDVLFASNRDWTYEKAALESSSYMVMNPVMAWFTANIGYHHIHHLNSRIPFYRLPEVMRHFPELQDCKKTNLTIKEIYTCFQLKVWDPEKQKMTGTKGLKPLFSFG